MRNVATLFAPVKYRGRCGRPSTGADGAMELPLIVASRVFDQQPIVLTRIAEGDLEDPARLRAAAAHPVSLLSRNPELLTRGRLDDPVPDLDRESGVEHDPHLFAQAMVMRSRARPRVDRDDPDRRRLIQRVCGQTSPRPVDDHPAFPAGSARISDAISSADPAASHPLFPCSPPARANACARSSVVRTSKMHGTPVVHPTSEMPRAASAAPRSKWEVSPRITAPRQISASNRPDPARRSATSGISKAPGTQATVTSSGTTPWCDKPAHAPSTSFEVTSSLNREATIATRRPA